MSNSLLMQPQPSLINPMRPLIIATTASVISLAIFYGMSQLIATGPIALPEREPSPIIELNTPLKEQPPKNNVRIPEKPQTPPPPPSRPVIDNFGDKQGFDVGIEGPAIDLAIKPSGDGMGQPQDQDATPVVRIDPKYPPEAARDGIQGWVQLSYAIAPDGSVTDVQVLAAEPRRIFDKSAIQALKRWKFRPKLEQGKAVVQQGLKVQLDFNLDQ